MYKCLDNRWCGKMTPVDDLAEATSTTTGVTVGKFWTKGNMGVWKLTTNAPSPRDEFDQKGIYCVRWILGSPIHTEPGQYVC